jgi:hypothetical protein
MLLGSTVVAKYVIHQASSLISLEIELPLNAWIKDDEGSSTRTPNDDGP